MNWLRLGFADILSCVAQVGGIRIKRVTSAARCVGEGDSTAAQTGECDGSQRDDSTSRRKQRRALPNFRIPTNFHSNISTLPSPGSLSRPASIDHNKLKACTPHGVNEAAGNRLLSARKSVESSSNNIFEKKGKIESSE